MRIDIHTHVLPGVDHGAKDWDESLKMLKKSADCGVEVVIATPHYWPWADCVATDVICECCKEAEQRLRKEYGISMNIYPGNEIYYSSETVDALKAGKALTLAKSRYVLVEFEPGVSYTTLCQAARDLRFHGYVPVFAHVERYQCLHYIYDMLELKEIGALLQVNADSFGGGIFCPGSGEIKWWLKQGLIDFIASDMHDLKKRPPMSSKSIEWIQKKLDPQYRDKLLYGNAQLILSGIKE